MATNLALGSEQLIMAEEVFTLSDSVNNLFAHPRIDPIQRAFFAPGFNSCKRENTTKNRTIMFESIVATKEIQRCRGDMARGLAPRPPAPGANEAEAFRPLTAVLGAEPDGKSRVRKISGRPNSDEVQPPSTEAKEARIEEPPAKRTLLLVDDEPNVLTALVRILRPFGYQILTAPDAATALQILADNEVGVILSDHRMPGMTGVELLSHVKTMYPMTVRMILSGHADISTVTHAIRLGAIYKFMTKPWDQTELCAVLQKAFEKYESGAQS